MRNIKTNTMRMFSLIAAVLSLGLVMAVSPMAASAGTHYAFSPRLVFSQGIMLALLPKCP